MGSNGHRGRGRGRGNGRGRGGRGGRGGGSMGGGGRGRNRTLYPSSYGFVYPLGEQDLSDDGEDFRLFGQFSDDSNNEENHLPQRKYKKVVGQLKGSDSHKCSFLLSIDKVVDLQPKQGGQHKSNSAKEPKKRTRRNNKATGEYSSITSTSTHFVQSTGKWNDAVDHATDDERDVDLNNLHLDIGNLDIDDADFLQLLDSSHSSSRAEVTVSVGDDDEDHDDDNDHNDNDDEDDDNDDSDSDSEEEFDMAIMRDYIENVELTEDDILNILAQNGDDQDLHEYLDSLDTDELDKLDRFLMQHGDGHMDSVVSSDDDDDDDDKDLLAYEERYLANHGLDDGDDDDEISPDMFRASLEDALAEIPPGLKPGKSKTSMS
ncbi:hypothetical protein [Absidia glauca]|uniref:Uncharacterized protein n=1 Tax=Absidia glauca TaxID=4829 RepID=A0A168QGV9_ABSGL|nr:hypothetical protein [Absidia glauca]